MGHYGESNKFRVYLIIRTFGLLLLRITTKLQECTEITTFPTPPSHNLYIWTATTQNHYQASGMHRDHYFCDTPDLRSEHRQKPTWIHHFGDTPDSRSVQTGANDVRSAPREFRDENRYIAQEHFTRLAPNKIYHENHYSVRLPLPKIE